MRRVRMRVGFSRYSTWVALAVLTAAGCQSASTNNYDANVQGTVTIDGQLAPGGTVTFSPVKKGPVAVGAIAADGSFALRVGSGESGAPDRSKMPSGEYVATVVVNAPPEKNAAGEGGGPLPVGPRLMADKYANKDTSGLTQTVTAGSNVIDLKLDGPWANPPRDEAKSEGDAGETAPADGAAVGNAAVESAPVGSAPAGSAAAPSTEATPAAAENGDKGTEGQK